MREDKFEKIVREAIEGIPKRFLEKLNNVDICIEKEPTPYQLKKIKKRKNSLIFGLYQGVPKTKRRNYGGVLPDKITIFKDPVERIARNRKEVKEIVKNTIWHEIAHHFGMSEKRVRIAETKRNN